MTRPPVDVFDQTFLVAAPPEVADRLADPALWRAWWPALELSVTATRGLEGTRWTVGGELAGTAELWLQPWHDGVIVHWFLRAGHSTPLSRRRARRMQDRYVRAYKRRIHALKDEFESGRPPGTPRVASEATPDR